MTDLTVNPATGRPTHFPVPSKPYELPQRPAQPEEKKNV